MAKIGDRKIEYLRGVRDMGLLDGMTRFRMVSDLRMFGIDIKDSFWNATPDEVFGSPEFETAVNAESLIGYCLDILCMGTDEEKIELFMNAREEVDRYVRKVTGAVERRLGGSRTGTGCGMQQCG